MEDCYSLPDDVRVGHVHLRVADLDRAIAFYRDTLGFTLRMDLRPIGVPAAFLGAGRYHHHVALNTFESAGAPAAPAGHTGLYHVAFVYPDRAAMARATARVAARGVRLASGRDHGATVSIYFADPDGNGVELYYDRPVSEWFDARRGWIVKNDAFDPRELIAEAAAEPAGAPA